MRTLVILNPTAGGRPDVDDLRRRIRNVIRGDFAVTSGSGEAVALAADAARSGYGTVVAAGGDGTVGEVATGLHHAGGVSRLGIVPVGTGNDLAASLGLPLDIERAAAVAVGPNTGRLDLIRAARTGEPTDPRFLANAAVAGFCGRIGDGMGPGLRGRLRPIAYPLAALGQLRDLRPYPVTVDVDRRRIETKALMIVVANGEYAGGRIRLAPGATVDDARLDVVVVHSANPLRLATLIPRVLAGRHTGHPAISTFRGAQARIASTSPMWINLDGDTWQAGPASFEVVPAALRVSIP